MIFNHYPLQEDPYGTLRVCLGEAVNENRDAALLATLAIYAGGSNYAFAMELEAEGATDGADLLRRVVPLWPPEGVYFASEVTVAALFAMEKQKSPLRALIFDQPVQDPDFGRLKGQLASGAPACRYLAGSQGELREETIRGPVSVITCAASGKTREFADSARLILARLAESPDHRQHRARTIVRAHTGPGWAEETAWGRFAETFREFMATLGAPPGKVLFPVEVERMIPQVRSSQLSHRMDQVLRVASAVASLRQNRRERHPEHADVLIGGLQDIADALELMLGARVADDQPAVSQRAVEFLEVLGKLDWKQNGGGTPFKRTGEGLTIVHLLDQLNRPALRVRAAGIVDDSKRRGDVGEIVWTRRVIKPHLDALRDAGLVGRNASPPYFWIITSQGRDCIAGGMATTLTHIWEAYTRAFSDHPSVQGLTQAEPGVTHARVNGKPSVSQELHIAPT